MRRMSSIARYGLLAVLLIALYAYTRSTIGLASPRLSYDDLGAPASPAPDARPSPVAPQGHERPGDFNSSSDEEVSKSPPSESQSQSQASHNGQEPPPSHVHPIDKLIYDAQLSFAQLVSRESKTIEQAARAYRKRRGRHPPPGFDKWFEFARKNKALIVEDFFDGIYGDLAPLWGVEPGVLRKESWDWEMTINVRDGNATAGSDFFWTRIWLDLIKTVEHLLPDMDLPLNAMDEPRVVVPWEDVAGYMAKASRTVQMPSPDRVIDKFQTLPAPGKGDLDVPTRARNFEDTKPYWKIARRGCAPDSLARQMNMQDWKDRRPQVKATYAQLHMHEGFVSNFTMSSDICHQPDLQNLQGIFIAPLSTSSTRVMTPMFGGSKLSVNNEILLPAPMYWAEEERFTGGDDHGVAWAEKKDQAVWRGVATGGKNDEHNWQGFQRHRFVAMNNGTTVARVELGGVAPENFALAEAAYRVRAQRAGRLASWIRGWSNVSFTDLNCSPPQDDNGCDYTGHYFEAGAGMRMGEQFASKYLPDIDGNSFSGRYLGFLRSTSLPIKATLWREWHDARLVAWKHFVPMDSRFVDYYGIMDYFLGFGEGEGEGEGGAGIGARSGSGHDHAAEKIAGDGKAWAERVLRKEDMSIYTLRLLLEYARLLDDERERLGWVDDLLGNPALKKIWKFWRP
ncbi:Beta-1 [Escovopsis weberi]|uniref:Beta-1 n=1 Tax=Escovopsis weberi TaxID=150374 RepID=A0A0M8N0E5_ESCWE|nr:Beta-1 [Escovopsis weberi]